MSSPWDPGQYERFRNERSQPFFDLLALVEPKPQMRVVDLGCGTGKLTRELHERLGAKETLGLDSSETMLARGADLARGGLRLERGDLASFVAAEPLDLVFSNAALHWVDGHEELLARLTSALAPGGQLAFQVPANQDHATHVLAAELASEEPFLEALGGELRRWPVLAPEAYASLVHRLGFAEQRVRLNVYPHVLDSSEEVLEWVKGTLLTWFRERLPPDLHERFIDEYRRRLLARLGDERPYFYPFKRILAWARL